MQARTERNLAPWLLISAAISLIPVLDFRDISDDLHLHRYYMQLQIRRDPIAVD